MNDRKQELKESEEKHQQGTPVQNIAEIKDIISLLNRFLQKPEINEDHSYVSLVKMKKDFNAISKKSAS